MTRLGSWLYHRRRYRRRAKQLFGDPVAPPAGWVGGPPDVVGVGVQKAGTTSWWALLTQHPDLHPPAGADKELHYFERFCTEPFTDQDADRYRGLFPRPAGALAGEWTPRYMSDPWTPPLLCRTAPDATLLVMLRDPVERARSGFDHLRRSGVPIDAGRFEQVLWRGHYAHQLRHLLRYYPAERIVVLQYEQCMAETEDHLHRTLAAIGLDPARHPGVRETRLNTTSDAQPLAADLRGWLQQYYEDEVRRLMDLTDAIDVARWPSFEHLAR